MNAAQTEIRERIEALRTKAKHNRKVAEAAENEATEAHTRAARCDNMADEYQRILDTPSA